MTDHGPIATDNKGPQRPRVLIVEPNRSYNHVLVRRLCDSGFRVSAAENAQRAMAELHRLPVDLVLSELRMSGTGGLDLVRIIRDDSRYRDVPLLLITGRTDKAGAVQAYGCGADAVIAKPFHFEVLAARIGREIERARSLARLREDKAALDARIVDRAIAIGELRNRLLASEAERRRLAGMLQQDL